MDAANLDSTSSNALSGAQHYSIDAIARITGISAFTLRNWEKRYDFLRPERLDNGFRVYTDAHIELLRRVSSLLRHGARIGELADSIRKGKELPELKIPELSPEVQKQASDLLDALLRFDPLRAEQLHDELCSQFDISQRLDLIYAPLLAQLGRDATETSVAQEHFASTYIRLKLAPLLSPPTPGSSHQRVLCTTVEGERHEGGLMLIAAHLRLLGWTPYYLGPDLPMSELKDAVARIQPERVCLSFTDRAKLDAALTELGKLGCLVCVGGFGALTFDSEERLPSNVRLLRVGGKDAAAAIHQNS